MLDLSRQLITGVCSGESVTSQCATCRDRSGDDRNDSASQRLPPSAVGHTTAPFPCYLTEGSSGELHALSGTTLASTCTGCARPAERRERCNRSSELSRV